jgi:type II secretory pathway component PulC
MGIVIKLLLVLTLFFATVTFWYGCLEERLTGDVRGDSMENKKNKNEDVVSIYSGKNNVVHGDNSKEQTDNDYLIIVGRNIFEAGLDGKPVVGKPEEDIEETGLNLILHGTITGSKQDSRAIIVDGKTRRQDLYNIGDEIQGGLITAIERGHIVLEVNNKREVLLLKERQGGQTGSLSRPVRTFAETPASAKRMGAARVNNRDISTAVPVAVPQRRISFRSEPVEKELLGEELRD